MNELELKDKRPNTVGVRVKTGFVADSALATDDGRVNALGIFEMMAAKTFPVRNQKMSLVLAFEIFAPDAGQKRKVTVRLVSEDGKQLGGDLVMDYDLPPAPVPQPRFVIWQPVDLVELDFPTAGTYAFSVSIDGQEPFSVPFTIIQE